VVKRTGDLRTMERHEFGSTGLEVSSLVFGGGMVGGLLIERDEATKRAAVEMALGAGINWIDTAPSYGDGRSEEALGLVLSQLDPALHVSTKVAIDSRDLRDVAGQVERSLTASLGRLRRSSVTLLQLHNPIGEETRGRMLSAETVLRRGGVLDAFDELERQRLIEHCGITALGELKSILQVIESGRVASAQVYFNLLNPSAAWEARETIETWPVYSFAGLLDACEGHGVAAMNIRVLSAGVIATDVRTGRERPLTPGDTVESEAAKAQRVFAVLGDRHGTRAQTAIRFALAERRLTCVIVGLAEIGHLQEAVAAAAMGPLPAEALSEIRSIYTAGG